MQDILSKGLLEFQKGRHQLIINTSRIEHVFMNQAILADTLEAETVMSQMTIGGSRK